jgi:hypothetical protein
MGNPLEFLISGYHDGFFTDGSCNSEAVRERLMWVDCTHIEDKEKHREALQVALHPKSYRLIENLTAALKYVTKYTGKLSDVHLEDAGPAWGRIGDVPKAEAIIEQMTDSEDAWFRRLARRSLRKGKRHFQGAEVQEDYGRSRPGYIHVPEHRKSKAHNPTTIPGL